MASATEYFAKYDDAILQQLRTFFDTAIRKATLISPRYELLWRELSRVTLNGGKRLRPKMMILAHEAFGDTTPDAVIPIAAGLEILHSSLLIHDDIIDREHARRGELNISGIYAEKYYEHISDTLLRNHFADSTALLGGDLLQFAALELIDQADITPSVRHHVRTLIYRTVFEVAGGQLFDSENAFMEEPSGDALTVARYKTASYSFIAPLLIGAVLAGVKESVLRDLESFAINLGIAFQLSDDLLGIFGDEQKTGKSTISDLREGKRTYLVETFMRRAGKADIRAFEASFGNPKLSEIDAEKLRSLLTKNGAVDECNSAISTYKTKAQRVLAQLPISDSSRGQFTSLIELSTKRNT